MSETDASTLTGHFLIAMPGLAESFFSRSVALLCQHNEEGALGLLVNRFSNLHLGDVLAQMKLPCSDAGLAGMPVLIGGPVQPERGFLLHRETGPWEASYRVGNSWSITTSRDILVALAKGEGPRQALLILGYAGWGAGQLEREVRNNNWLTTQASEQIVFDTPLEERWSAAAGLMGIDPLKLPSYAGHA